jgi:hypothetical protein
LKTSADFNGGEKLRKNLLAFFVVVLFVGMIFLAPAQALLVQDRWTDDLNTVSIGNMTNNSVIINEVYGEDNLVAYTSLGGIGEFGVVDNDAGEPVHYFDKIFTLEQSDFESGWLSRDNLTDGIMRFAGILNSNNTPFEWTDYHFEFWNADFTQRLDWEATNLGGPAGSQSAAGPGYVDFWDLDVATSPATTLQFRLNDIDSGSGAGYVFGIRQVATTVPVPGAIWLLCSGLLGLLGIRRKMKK